MKANRLLALAALLCLLLPCGQALAQGNPYVVTFQVRPAGAGSVYMDGVPLEPYPYALPLVQGELHTYQGVPRSNLESFKVWSGAMYAITNPLVDTSFGSERTIVANFNTRLPVISGQVWNDINNDGVRDEETEELLTGWTVALCRASDDTVVAQADTFTDPYFPNINYSLMPPEAGTYYVKFFAKPNWVAIPKGAHSDPDPATGKTENVNLVLDGPDVTFNAGFFEFPQVTSPDIAKIAYDLDRELKFIDVREYDEYCTGHVPCIFNLPWDSGVLAAEVDQLAADIGLDAYIVVVSSTGVRSAQAAQFLVDYGFTDVTNMSPGMDGTGNNDGWRWAVYTCDDTFPVAVAGPKGVVAEGSTYTLSTAGSTEYYIYQYVWSQVGPANGPYVTLSNPYSTTPNFVAPPVSLPVTLTFQLSVVPQNRECGPVITTVDVGVTDNGIDIYPEDVTTFYSYNGYPLGVLVNSGGGLCRLLALDDSPYTSAEGDPPDGLPYGLFDLGFRADTAGGVVNVTFYFPVEEPDYYNWFKFHEGAWMVYAENAWWNQAHTRLTLELTDGGDGDDDGSMDAIIRDPGGLGYFNQIIPDPTPDEPATTRGDDSGNSRGCFLDALRPR